MKITFSRLEANHLPLFYEWLQKPHVKTWWDPDMNWTPELLQEKYSSYAEGYYFENGIKKPLQAFMVDIDNKPAAYIQLYDIRNYPGAEGILEDDTRDACTGLDIFIGDETFLGKGYGTIILKTILSQHVSPQFDACYVDPDKQNLQAIRAYEKAGFRVLREAGQNFWMMWSKTQR